MNKKDRENRSVHKNRSGVDTTWILAGILVVLLIVAAVVYIGKKTSGTGDSGASAAPAGVTGSGEPSAGSLRMKPEQKPEQKQGLEQSWRQSPEQKQGMRQNRKRNL